MQSAKGCGTMDLSPSEEDLPQEVVKFKLSEELDKEASTEFLELISQDSKKGKLFKTLQS